MKYKGEIAHLRKRFEVRWKNIEKRTNSIDRLTLPPKHKLWRLLLASYSNGFKCEYCQQEMMIKDSEYPYGRSFSFDHRISIDVGGTNEIENFAVVCHKCNIIKGTATEETFTQIIDLLPIQLMDKLFQETWNGHLANKLKREDVWNLAITASDGLHEAVQLLDGYQLIVKAQTKKIKQLENEINARNS